MLGIYIRKSVDHDKQKSLREQELLGIELANRIDKPYTIYNEGIVSGADISAERPKFKEMISDIEKGKLEGIFIWETSRAARNTKSWLVFADILKDNNVVLYDNGMSIDLSDPQQYMFYTQKAAYDEFYAKLTSEKIKTVLKRNAMNGFVQGRPPIGYRKGESGKVEIDPERSKLVKRIFRDSLKGKGSRAIANELSEEGIPTQRNKKFWASNTILDIIKNPYYKGVRIQGGVEYEVPSIFDETYWQKVNDNLKKNRIFSGRGVDHKYLLNKGMIVCGVCGKNYFGRKNSNSKWAYYLCASRKSRLEDCHNRALNLEVFESFVWNNLFRNDEMYKRVKQAFKKGDSEERSKSNNLKLNQNKKNIKEIKKKISNNYQNFIEELVDKDNYISTKNSLESKLQRAMELLETLEKEQQLLNDEKRFLTEIKNDIPMPKEWMGHSDDQYYREYNERLWRKSLAKAELKSNKLIIDSSIPFSEKKEIIGKYIKQIKVTFEHKRKFFRIEVAFNIPIPNEIYIINDLQDFAGNKKTKDIFPIKPMKDYSPYPSGQNVFKKFNHFKKKFEKLTGGGKIHHDVFST
ncbi:recombinase family protein [Flagellimonas profundi]|uniref:Recombinase family protein n=1 Tax=Flagellimonas profundi TaxID=2915620 RepID=A0ABS3FCQ0_9FLAO|nr:recombinase family protein [Allomuricauda profundi]MBO0340935.1 recombinase family protein [Allomuricauda profundi]